MPTDRLNPSQVNADRPTYPEPGQCRQTNLPRARSMPTVQLTPSQVTVNADSPTYPEPGQCRQSDLPRARSIPTVRLTPSQVTVNADSPTYPEPGQCRQSDLPRARSIPIVRLTQSTLPGTMDLCVCGGQWTDRPAKRDVTGQANLCPCRLT